MAGIGDYIHYKKANYRKFGTFKDGASNFSQVTEIYKKQREDIKRRLPSTKSKNLKELENFLNGMMYGKEDSSKQDQDAMKELQDRVYKVFSEHYSNFGIDFRKGLDVYYKNEIAVTRIRSIGLKILEKYLQIIKDMANNVIKLTDKADMSKIESAVKSLETYINTHQDEKNISLTNNKAATDLIAEINTVLKMQSVPRQVAIGDVFEYWLALASQYAGAKSVEIADNLIIDELVKGSSRSNPIISMNNFSDEYVSMDELLSSGAFSPDWKPINENTAFRFNKPTQDKLDVIFNWKGDELKVSAKNYKLEDSSSTIHLVQGTSLLYLISTENADFINHWLNTVSGTKSDWISSKLLQAAHIEMKLTIFAKALSGMDMSNKSNISDTFILNNRTQKHIYVKSMREIFDAIESLISEDLKEVKFSNYPNRIPNVWVGAKKGTMSEVSAQQRISNLIASLHTYKISVSMTPSKILTK